MFGLKRKLPIQAPTEIAGLRVRTHPRARRMALRVDTKLGDVVLTWPRGTTEKMALRFIEENRRWIEERRRRIPVTRPFAAGEVISVAGQEYTLVHREGRGLTRFEGQQLIVHGKAEHLSRRVKDFLKEIARQVLEEKTAQKMQLINRDKARVRILDPKGRWGSCGSGGNIMFSWRLILTPPLVMDYVVAHEVAHCIHMNHSRKFWTLCASLTTDAVGSKRWLKLHGAEVMIYQ